MKIKLIIAVFLSLNFFGFEVPAPSLKKVNKTIQSTYNIEKSNINILMKNGDVIDITSASDQFNIDALSKTVNKHFLCYPNKI